MYCVYVRVCTYIHVNVLCVCTCMYVHTCYCTVCMYVYVRTYMLMYCVYVRVCTYIQVNVHICIYTCICTYIRTCTFSKPLRLLYFFGIFSMYDIYVVRIVVYCTATYLLVC